MYKENKIVIFLKRGGSIEDALASIPVLGAHRGYEIKTSLSGKVRLVFSSQFSWSDDVVSQAELALENKKIERVEFNCHLLSGAWLRASRGRSLMGAALL